ncbi:hypothetical protein SEPCBS119000_000380 [Sporothrix epigloea]|uniref:Developmental regulatory protein wetA n=1 Tax=Sporothrix epigloea TaxID=1892477 RepID=A0ABP0D546_9PEZI
MFAGSLESRCEKNPPNQLGQSREFDGANGSEQLHQMDQQSDLLSRLSCMSQQELDQMNAVLDQCQILDNGQILFGSACGGYSNNTGGSLPLTDNLHQYRFDQQPPPQTSQHREQQVQQKQYLQRLYLQQLQLHNEEQKKFDAAEAARQRQAQASPSCASLQQPFHRELPVYFDAAPSFAGPPYPIAQQLAGEIAQQRARQLPLSQKGIRPLDSSRFNRGVDVPSDQATLSPKKQRTVSSSPKKPGRLESIYASIRNKTANMRRSRTTFTHEAAPSSVVPLSTVAPLATLRDATFLSENSYNNIQSHHIHSRSSNCGDLDLDLALELDLNLDLGLNLNAKSAAMGSFPPTPPLTGVASSLSSASSSFSMSACSSVASSAADSHLFSHPLAAQVSHNPLYSHNLPYQHPGSSEEDLSHVDMATFVSGVVDDPFADSGAYFGNCSDMPVHQHQHHQPLPLHTEAQYPPQRVSDSGVSSACWPTSLTMPNSRTPPLQQQEDNDVTPVTLAMNIPGRTELLSNISPSAYLANAAANMSGAPVIASANASVAAAAAANMMKQKALGNNAMDIDENWWQDCVVDSAVGEPLQASSINFDSVYGAASSLPAGYPCDHIDNNTQALGTSGNMQYCMPDLASQGLMIDMAPVATNPGGAYPRSQYYFPGIAATSGGNAYPPGPPAPLAGEYESRHDRASASSRRSKPRAPSAGARYHSTSRGDGLHSPRKRPSATNLSKTNSSSSSAGFYSGDSVSGISAAMMTAPSTPRSHHQLGRRSHSMQNLSRTSPTPGGSGSMGTLSNTTTPSKGAIQKRRSAGNLRRVSSTQGITSLTAAAAITAAVGATGMPEPKTPRRQRSTSADPSRPRSVAANSGAFFASEDNKFFNFTASDHQKLMSGVAPSGSSKTKARRERALQEKTRKLSEQLMRAMQEAGGDVTKLEAEGLKDLAITL